MNKLMSEVCLTVEKRVGDEATGIESERSVGNERVARKFEI
jgi:hypothetical protein